MEYVADRLGLIFVRINCPALGHGVTAIDPANAPNSAARQELEKLNLGLAMGSNVMLYLDDIQHTSPEFLQKFIALADGTRRIEGVWNGEPRSYDMRGKRFARRDGGQPVHRVGRRLQDPGHAGQPRRHLQPGRRALGPRSRIRAVVHREQPHVQPHADAAGLARPEGRATAGEDGAGPRGAEQLAVACLQRGSSSRDQGTAAAALSRTRPAAQGQSRVHRVGRATGGLSRGAAVQAAGQLPQHDQARGQDHRADARRRTRCAFARPLPRRSPRP
jgi:hypothetical protein